MKVIFSDIDGTLLNSRHHVSPYTKEVLNEAHKAGHKLVLASGRAYDGMITIFNELPFTPIAATLNGAYIVDEDRSVIFKSPMKRELLLRLEEKFSELSVDYFYFYGEHWGSGSDNKYVRRELEVIKSQALIKPLSVLEFEVEKVLAIVEDGDEVLIELRKSFPDLVIAKSAPNYIEITNGSIHKGNAVDKVTEYFGLTNADAIAFGDYDNDIEMLKVAGISYAMSNATENTKKAAKRIGLSNDEDGVAKALVEILGL